MIEQLEICAVCGGPVLPYPVEMDPWEFIDICPRCDYGIRPAPLPPPTETPLMYGPAPEPPNKEEPPEGTPPFPWAGFLAFCVIIALFCAALLALGAFAGLAYRVFKAAAGLP